MFEDAKDQLSPVVDDEGGVQSGDTDGEWNQGTPGGGFYLVVFGIFYYLLFESFDWCYYLVEIF